MNRKPIYIGKISVAAVHLLAGVLLLGVCCMLILMTPDNASARRPPVNAETRQWLQTITKFTKSRVLCVKLYRKKDFTSYRPSILLDSSCRRANTLHYITYDGEGHPFYSMHWSNWRKQPYNAVLCDYVWSGRRMTGKKCQHVLSASHPLHPESLFVRYFYCDQLCYPQTRSDALLLLRRIRAIRNHRSRLVLLNRRRQKATTSLIFKRPAPRTFNLLFGELKLMLTKSR